jgi:uncharacterized protein HemX
MMQFLQKLSITHWLSTCCAALALGAGSGYWGGMYQVQQQMQQQEQLRLEQQRADKQRNDAARAALLNKANETLKRHKKQNESVGEWKGNPWDKNWDGMKPAN